MASVKIVLRRKKNNDGTYPLSIRITKDRESSYVYTGHHILETFWDEKNRKVKKSHPNSVRLNHLLSKKLAEAEDNLLDLEVQKNDVSSAAIKMRMKGSKETSFFNLADNYISELKSTGKFNRFKADTSRVKSVKEFLNGRDITFKEITVPLISRYRSWLKATGNKAEVTIVNKLKILRTLFNIAIDNGLVEHKYYPFGKNKIDMRTPMSLKIGLKPEEVKQLEGLRLVKNSPEYHAKNIWLLSFYFAGMRVSDLLRLKWADFQNDRLYYVMGKNSKTGSLKVPEKAMKILLQYKGQENNHDLIFPYLKDVVDMNDTFIVQKRISFFIEKLNASLKIIAERLELSKKLTMHIARHTFGNISGDKIPIQMLQKLYRHSSITTTIGYQANFIYKEADDALESVINL
ncbi:MAG: site-specific integrase [Bacteroidetes bacterium]|nr:site-specific integrase [Bacteroidota bacterium]